MSLAELNSDIASFRHFLQAERGLADNTVQAYGRDLTRFVPGVPSCVLPSTPGQV